MDFVLIICLVEFANKNNHSIAEVLGIQVT